MCEPEGRILVLHASICTHHPGTRAEAHILGDFLTSAPLRARQLLTPEGVAVPAAAARHAGRGRALRLIPLPDLSSSRK